MNNYTVYSINGMEKPRNEYLLNLKRAKKEIGILCGELDPEFYNSDKFIETIGSFLTIPDSKLSIIFNGNSGIKEEAVDRIKSMNHNMLENFKKYFTNTKEINLFWIPIRAKRHFTIIDYETVLVEGSHEVGKPRNLHCFVKNIEVYSEWEKRFEDIKNYSKGIDSKILYA